MTEEQLYGLTADDVAYFRELRQWFDLHRVEGSEVREDRIVFNRSSDVFICKADADIPAKFESGGNDVPGSGTGKFFKIDNESTLKILPVEYPDGAAYTETVYNVAKDVIRAGIYFLASRTRWGFWVATPPGGGGGADIIFWTPVGGIPARSGLQMGSATCTVMSSSSSGLLSSSARNETIFNVSDEPVAECRYGKASLIEAGIYVIDVESCLPGTCPSA